MSLPNYEFRKGHTGQKKDFHDPDNHEGVITHLEPNILKCEVKWALGRSEEHTSELQTLVVISYAVF